MILTLRILLLLVVSNLIALPSLGKDEKWQWETKLEQLIFSSNFNTQNIKVGSYGNQEYRKAVFSISNFISKGWSDKHFDANRYNKVLTKVWNNPKKLRLLTDDLIRLAALKWKIYLKTRCFNSEVDTLQAQRYFYEMINSNENVIKNSAISGLGMLGNEADIETLIELIIDNHDNFVGNSAWQALTLFKSNKAIDSVRARLKEIPNSTIKAKIRLELSVKRVWSDNCSS